MMVPTDKSKSLQQSDMRTLRFLLIVFFISMVWIVYQLFSYSAGLEVLGSSIRWTITLGAGLLLVLIFALLIVLTWTRFG